MKLTIFTMASAISLAIGSPALAQAMPPASIAGSPTEQDWRALAAKEASLRLDVTKLQSEQAKDRTELADAAASKDRALTRAGDARRAFERLMAAPPPSGNAKMADNWAEKVAEAADDWYGQERKHEDGAKKWRKAEDRESKSASSLRKAQDRLDRVVRERVALEQRAAMANR